MTTANARDYLLPDLDSFWQWETDGEAVEWDYSKTIAFRPELAEVARGLASQGLPPLSAILLLIAATRDNWREWDTESQTLEVKLDGLPNAAHAQATLQRVLQGLDRVHQLPKDLRQTMDAKVVLCEMALEHSDVPRTSTSTAREVVGLLDEGIQEELVHQHWANGSARLLDALECLAVGLERVDETTLRNRIKTGLDTLPLAAQELAFADRVRTLLADLAGDEQLSALAQLAQKLLAAITLPRQVSAPDELPVGGVSDISNRGSLDRLLLSELANDDLTLSVRVAMNEALYLRRETPKRTLPRRRAVLLESGIRTWGLPRVFATAVGLALAAAADSNEQAEVFRASGASLADVDLTTRDGLIEHLAALDLDLHPGDAWPLFCELAVGDQTAEPILVTTAEAAEDAEFKRIVSENPLRHFLVATVNRDGEFHLYQQSPRGVKSLRRAQLDLTTLLEQPDRADAIRQEEWLEQLPPIFRHRTMPLRVAQLGVSEMTWHVAGKGVLSLTRDRRLVYFSDLDEFGARQLCDTLAGHLLVWGHHQVDDQERTWAVVGPTPQLLEITLDENPRCRVQPLHVPALRTAFFHGGMLMGVAGDRVVVINRETGEPANEAPMPFMGMSWVRGRFFLKVEDVSQTEGGEVSQREWYSAGADGNGVVFTKIPLKKVMETFKDRSVNNVISMFEAIDADGPVAVTNHGELINLEDGQRRVLKLDLDPPMRLAAVNRAGTVLVMEGTSAHTTRFVRVASNETPHRTSRPKTPVLPDPLQRRNVNVRVRVKSVRINADGKLTLLSRNDSRLILTTEAGNMVLQQQAGELADASSSSDAAAAPIDGVGWETFEPMQIKSPLGVRFKKADLKNDAQVILDSRGMLHFIPPTHLGADRMSPFTLVLHQLRVAGWSERHGAWGDPFFTGGESQISDEEAYRTLVQPFLDAVR